MRCERNYRAAIRCIGADFDRALFVLFKTFFLFFRFVRIKRFHRVAMRRFLFFDDASFLRCKIMQLMRALNDSFCDAVALQCEYIVKLI